MSIFVISLENAKSRQDHIKQEFSKEKIPFSFFKAVTPKDINNVSERLGIDVSNADLTDGEKACFLSQASLWQKVIDENLDYICIFEDDIYLGKNINQFLLDISCYPKDFDIIKLESFDNPILVDSTFKKQILSRNIYKLASGNLGAAGYILSRNCAIKLMCYLQNSNEIEAVDYFLFETLIYNKNFNIYHIEPSICKQDFLINGSHDNFSSSLEPERKVRINNLINRKKNKISFSKKVIRELLRVFKIIPKLFERKPKQIFSNFR